MRLSGASFLLVVSLLVGCAASTGDVGSSEAAQTADARLERLAATLSAAGRASLAELVAAHPDRLAATDHEGRTTLDGLLDLTTERHPAIEAATGPAFTAAAIRDAVVADVAHPERIHQGPYNTCQITDFQYALASGSPAEYVRLMAGITGRTGRAGMRGGGRLDLYTAYLAPRAEDGRSASEAIFQSTVMNEITGTYDANRDVNRFLFWTYPGNSTRMAEPTAEALFGRPYDVQGQHDVQIALDPLSRMDRGEARAFLDHVRPDLRAPAIVDAVLDGMGTSHSLVLERIEGERVFFRNPWGPQTPAQGAGKVEDAERAIYSLTKDELADRMQAFLAPR